MSANKQNTQDTLTRPNYLHTRQNIFYTKKDRGFVHCPRSLYIVYVLGATIALYELFLILLSILPDYEEYDKK